jgi:hypothetical protein
VAARLVSSVGWALLLFALILWRFFLHEGCMGAHWRGSRRNKPRAPTAEDPAEDDERDAADVDPHPAAFGSRWWIVDLDL